MQIRKELGDCKLPSRPKNPLSISTSHSPSLPPSLSLFLLCRRIFIPPSVIHYGRSVYKITDMYMQFELSCFKCKPRTSEALVSPPRTLDTDHCLSFWVYMYTTIASLTHIGALKVRVYLSPSWPSD